MLLLAFSALFYLDLFLLLLGGIITGTLLILTQKRFNKIVGRNNDSGESGANPIFVLVKRNYTFAQKHSTYEIHRP